MKLFGYFTMLIILLFVSISGCTSLYTDPIEGCWYTSLMGAQMNLQFNSGGSAYISSSMGTGAMVWEKVGTDHYIMYPAGDKSKKYDIYYSSQTQSISLDTNQKMFNQNFQIQFLKTKCTG